MQSLKDPEKHSYPESIPSTSPSGSIAALKAFHKEDEDESPLTPGVSKVSRFSRQEPLSRHATSIKTTATSDPTFEVDWEDDDPENPKNWPTWRKGMIIGFVSWATFVVVVYSTSYTTGLGEMAIEFHTSEPVVTIGVTTYLIGLAVGSLILAPLSEIYGRRPVYIITMAIFILLIIPCGLATSLSEVLIVRFFGALAGSAMISNSPGSLSDIVTDEFRPLAFSIWAIGPMNGPTFGPIIGGFVTQYLGWRWANWVVMMMSGVALVFVILMPETYAPALLVARASRLRKSTSDSRYWSRYDQKASLVALLKINLSRPFVMAVTEPICIFWNIYIAIIYGILYLCFVAYPIVFTGIRGWEIGISGLAFIGIGVGALTTIACEPLIRKVISRQPKDPATGRPPPEANISVVCVAAVLVPVGEIWFAWTCAPPVHWIWPILAGIPFGAGNTAIFIYASNYVAGSYGIYAASAMAGNAVVRSLLGGTLPLAGPAMYATLGPHWAGTLLGLLQVAIIPIPVMFWRYGGSFRKRSTLITSMQGDRERLEGKRLQTSGQAGKEQQIHDEEIAMETIAEAGIAGVQSRDMEFEVEAELEKENEMQDELEKTK